MSTEKCQIFPVGKGRTEHYHGFVKAVISHANPESKFIRIRYQPGDDEMQSWAFLDIRHAPSPQNGLTGDETIAVGTITGSDFDWRKDFSDPDTITEALAALYERMKKDQVEIHGELQELHLRVTRANLRTIAEETTANWPILAPMLEDDPGREPFERLISQTIQGQITSLPLGMRSKTGTPRCFAVWPADVVAVEHPEWVMRGYADDFKDFSEVPCDFWAALFRVQARREKRILDGINGLLALLKGGVA